MKSLCTKLHRSATNRPLSAVICCALRIWCALLFTPVTCTLLKRQISLAGPPTPQPKSSTCRHTHWLFLFSSNRIRMMMPQADGAAYKKQGVTAVKLVRQLFWTAWHVAEGDRWLANVGCNQKVGIRQVGERCHHGRGLTLRERLQREDKPSELPGKFQRWLDDARGA